jgi:formate hydrogenlyase subunit 6/NADH:ubiquinone oxidoreductase subunit I
MSRMAVDIAEVLTEEAGGQPGPQGPPRPRRRLPPAWVLAGVGAGLLAGGVASMWAWFLADASFIRGALTGAAAAAAAGVVVAIAVATLAAYVARGAPGLGLVKGLVVTLKHMLQPSITQEYPEERPDLPPRTRGVIALKEANCTVCYKCSRECPDWCIYIDAHKETHEPAGGGRARSAKVLDRFAIDYALCMYCGICVEVCPFDALFWTPEFEYAEYDIRNLIHEKERLEEWTYTALAPPELEVGAEPAGETLVAERGPDQELAVRPQPEMPSPAAPTAPAGAPPAGPEAPEQVDTPPAEAAGPSPEQDTPSAAVAGEGTEAPTASGAQRERVEVEPDQEVYDRVLAEQLAQGKDRRVAEGQAKRAAMLAARKKAGGG